MRVRSAQCAIVEVVFKLRLGGAVGPRGLSFRAMLYNSSTNTHSALLTLLMSLRGKLGGAEVAFVQFLEPQRCEEVREEPTRGV